ncbi:U-box domain-containing protein 56 isoform X2 [Capsella rubella]|nr:U-box domain-containing protein 56 isoform X2 [Capsella rubella]XP_023645159.1 U-box domain-containing protein 56 isoform X2 [Capsella rubella]XP_023645160.1 U-box domain-containing protein 56 isoform X2 [Capsella rubella]
MSYFSANNVGEWIVELIYQNNIKKLIMGATADSHYSEGMVQITSTNTEYVIRHAPHCCKIWLVCNGNLIQTREGRFELAGSSYYSYSESSSSIHSLDTDMLPYGGTRRAERVTEPHPFSSSEERSASGFETTYYEEQRRRLEIEELKREKEQRDKMRNEREGALSNSFGVTQILYNEEVIRRREAEAELNRAKDEIEDMKRVQKEHEEQHYTDCRLLELIQKERDEAIKTTEELLIHLNLENAVSSLSPSSPLQWSLSDEPPQCFLCPISKEIMRNPHVAADGHTYEVEEFRRWLRHGGEKSPMTNLRLENDNLTPNLVLRSAIRDWLQQHPYIDESS